MADYACCREDYDLYFFLKRKIIYGGKVYGNKNAASFYINGTNSPLGRKMNAPLAWDESERYMKTEKEGVFLVNDKEKAQPFLFQFRQTDNTGKYIVSDELYFELGKYPYPLPTNSIQGMSFCTMSPGEVECLNNVLFRQSNKIEYSITEVVEKKCEPMLFDKSIFKGFKDISYESQIEYRILATLEPLKDELKDHYVLCRQVPISPYKPYQMDRADICLYSTSNPINNGTIPNIVIELKKGKAGRSAIFQIFGYLKWLKMIAGEDFEKIVAYVIAEEFSMINKKDVDEEYVKKVKLYSLKQEKYVEFK